MSFIYFIFLNCFISMIKKFDHNEFDFRKINIDKNKSDKV
jgi:hypothetical protein